MSASVLFVGGLVTGTQVEQHLDGAEQSDSVFNNASPETLTHIISRESLGSTYGQQIKT